MLLATKKGNELIKSFIPLLQESFQARLSGLKDWEQTQLLASLQRIAEMMNAEQLDASPLLTSGAASTSAEAVNEALSPAPPPRLSLKEPLKKVSGSPTHERAAIIDERWSLKNPPGTDFRASPAGVRRRDAPNKIKEIENYSFRFP